MTVLDRWVDHVRGTSRVMRMLSGADRVPRIPDDVLDEMAAHLEVDLDRETLRMMAFTLGILGQLHLLGNPDARPGDPDFGSTLAATSGQLLEAVVLRLDPERVG